MHELSVCRALLDQVIDIARQRGAAAVERITIEVGPLCGTEPHLLSSAFAVMRHGVTAAAELTIKCSPVSIRCTECGEISRTAPNRLVCGVCGGWRIQVLSGDEMRLMSLELRVAHV
jgi:hydrogenase nickel incorporation protein HypA/HybF